jgi:hypothetical protein
MGAVAGKAAAADLVGRWATYSGVYVHGSLCCTDSVQASHCPLGVIRTSTTMICVRWRPSHQ